MSEPVIARCIGAPLLRSSGSGIIARKNIRKQCGWNDGLGRRGNQKTRAALGEFTPLIPLERNQLRLQIKVGEQIRQEQRVDVGFRLRIRGAIENNGSSIGV